MWALVLVLVGCEKPNANKQLMPFYGEKMFNFPDFHGNGCSVKVLIEDSDRVVLTKLCSNTDDRPDNVYVIYDGVYQEILRTQDLNYRLLGDRQVAIVENDGNITKECVNIDGEHQYCIGEFF